MMSYTLSLYNCTLRHVSTCNCFSLYNCNFIMYFPLYVACFTLSYAPLLSRFAPLLFLCEESCGMENLVCVFTCGDALLVVQAGYPLVTSFRNMIAVTFNLTAESLGTQQEGYFALTHGVFYSLVTLTFRCVRCLVHPCSRDLLDENSHVQPSEVETPTSARPCTGRYHATAGVAHGIDVPVQRELYHFLTDVQYCCSSKSTAEVTARDTTKKTSGSCVYSPALVHYL